MTSVEVIEISATPPSSEKVSPPVPNSRRLDMQHGFLRYIWKNQIDRDEFHKIQEKRKTDIKQKLMLSPKSEVTNLYVPPALRRMVLASSPSTSIDSGYYRKMTEPESNDEKKNEKPLSSSAVLEESEEEKLRKSVRRRFERSVPSVDDLVLSFANASVQENKDKRSNTMDDNNSDERSVFTLHMKMSDGKDVLVDIPKSTQAARIAKLLSRKHNLNDSQCRQLRIFIEEELNTRLSLKD